jgi:lysyl-tRNA synthetase class I
VRLTIKGKNGSLNQYTQKVRNKRGEVVEYPKVRGERDPDNPKHWQWKLTWKESVDGRWVTRGINVKPTQVAKVRKYIAQNAGIHQIGRFLGK